jgi:hypothetical protein
MHIARHADLQLHRRGTFERSGSDRLRVLRRCERAQNEAAVEVGFERE